MSDIIKTYLDELSANGIKTSTLNKIRPTLTQLDNRLEGDILSATKHDITQFILSWTGATEGTKATRKAIIKKFFIWAGKDELVKDIKIKMPRNNLTSDDILTPDDINKLIDATDSHYYKALIALLFESGARGGEIQALKVKDFKETEKGMIVAIPTFKTDFPNRNVLLLFSAQYIRNYIMYSAKGEDEIVFHLGKSATNEQLNKIKNKAGINKPISRHKFRHAQATDLVKRGYNEAIIRKKLGWTPTSPMIARYQHLNDYDVINATLEKAQKIPVTATPHTDIKEAERLNIVDASMQFSKLSEENETLKAEMETMKRQMELITEAMKAKQLV